jgi:hypothetical protein
VVHPKSEANTQITEQFQAGAINKGSGTFVPLRDEVLASGSDSDSESDLEPSSKPEVEETVTSHPQDEVFDELCAQLPSLPKVRAKANQPITQQSKIEDNTMRGEILAPQQPKSPEVEVSKPPGEQPVIRHSTASEAHAQAPRVLPPPSTFGRRIELNLDKFLPLPDLYNRCSVSISTRPYSGIDSKEERRNRLLGVPSRLTLMGREQEAMEANVANKGRDGGGGGGPSGPLPLFPPSPPSSGPRGDDGGPSGPPLPSGQFDDGLALDGDNGKNEDTNDDDNNMGDIDEQSEMTTTWTE